MKLIGVLRSRLLQFVVIGTVIWTVAPKQRRERDVSVDAATVAAAFRSEQARVGRPLTGEEKQRVMSDLVADEVLLREGMRLGLGLDDAVVRARVADRMRGHLEAASPVPVSAAEVREEATREATRMPLRMRLAIAFVSKDRPDAARDADVLARALSREPDAAAPYGGDRAPLDAIELWREEDLARAAGAAVARAAVETNIGSWSAPIASAWGFYLVRPLERRAATADEAMSAATAEVRRRKSAEAVLRAIGRVTSDYDVTVRAPAGEPAFDPTILKNAADRDGVD